MFENKTNIWKRINASTGQIAVLIDPEKANSEESLLPLIEKARFAQIDYFFVGGSTVLRQDLEKTIQLIKRVSDIPVVIFPGSSNQLSNQADALLFLSLVSGRNPDYLITHHVNCVEEVMHMDVEVIPTAYLLIDGGTKSSVAYVSQTTPIPREQTNIAVNTAMAAILQGKQLVYFDAGSGAKETVPVEFIQKLKKFTDTPIIVGGGIRNKKALNDFKKAGVNVMVIGNHLEEHLDFLLDIHAFKSSNN